MELLLIILGVICGFISGWKDRERVYYKQWNGSGRPPIPPSVRYEVYRRDGFACRYCGTSYDIQVDHIYPRSKGGPDHIDNYQTLCATCNRIKSDKIL